MYLLPVVFNVDLDRISYAGQCIMCVCTGQRVIMPLQMYQGPTVQLLELVLWVETVECSELAREVTYKLCSAFNKSVAIVVMLMFRLS